MKKHTTKTEPIQDPDPADGMKAVGCLFIGIVLIIGFLALSSWFINYLRNTP